METSLFLSLIIWLILILFIIFNVNISNYVKFVSIFIFLVYLFVAWDEVVGIFMNQRWSSSVFWLKSIYNTMHLYFYSLPLLWITSSILLFFMEDSNAFKKLFAVNIFVFVLVVFIYVLLLVEIVQLP